MADWMGAGLHQGAWGWQVGQIDGMSLLHITMTAMSRCCKPKACAGVLVVLGRTDSAACTLSQVKSCNKPAGRQDPSYNDPAHEVTSLPHTGQPQHDRHQNRACGAMFVGFFKSRTSRHPSAPRQGCSDVTPLVSLSLAGANSYFLCSPVHH